MEINKQLESKQILLNYFFIIVCELLNLSIQSSDRVKIFNFNIELDTNSAGVFSSEHLFYLYLILRELKIVN